MKTPSDHSLGASKSARNVVERLAAMFEPRRYRTTAVVTSVQTDSAGRVTGAIATIDGLGGQAVATDFGAPVSVGDVYQVQNMGSPTAVSWTVVRRLSSTLPFPNAGTANVLPTPTGLALRTWVVQTAEGPKSYIYAFCNTVADIFGGLVYRFEYTLNVLDEPPVQVAVADVMATGQIVEAVTSGQTVIPHSLATESISRYGRIKLESELVDYEAVTFGSTDSGTGTGGTNSFTDTTKSWTVNRWVGFALTVGGATYLVTANTATALTVAGTPATGAYIIEPAFSQCTRGAGGSTAASHADNKTFIRRSMGALFSLVARGTDHNVRVRVESPYSGSLSGWSSYVSVTSADDTIPPDILTGMGYTALSATEIRLFWTKSAAPDLAYYDVAYTWLPGGPPGGYMAVSTAVPYYSMTWAQGQPLYWKVRAVDRSGNAGPYCAEQTAWGVAVVYTELPNSGFELGAGSPTDWTLSSTTHVTTSWLSTGGYGDTKAIQVAITAGSGANSWFTALKSIIIAIQQGVTYLSPGFLIYLPFRFGELNLLSYTIYQYKDTMGTPAEVPYIINQLYNTMSTSEGDWVTPSAQHVYNYTAPVGSDVTHIALAFEVHTLATYAHTLKLDNASFAPSPIVFSPTDHGSMGGLTDDDHTQYVHNSTARTVTAQHTFAPETAQAPFAIGENAVRQTVVGLRADYLNIRISQAEPSPAYQGMVWLLMTTTASLTAACRAVSATSEPAFSVARRIFAFATAASATSTPVLSTGGQVSFTAAAAAASATSAPVLSLSGQVSFTATATAASATSTPELLVPTALVDIDHEGGSLGEYNSTQTDSGDLSVTSGAALASTSYGMSAVINDTNSIYGAATISSSTGIIRARFYIDPNTLSMVNTNSIVVMRVLNGSSQVVAYAQLAYSAGAYGLRVAIYNDSGTPTSATLSTITDAPHYLEFELVRATGESTNDGYIDWWVDGSAKTGLTGVDNYTRFASAASVQMGAITFVGTPTGTLYLDELIVNDTGDEIGA